MWKSILQATFHRLSTGGWIANLIVGVILLLVTPLLSSAMQPKAAILCAASGLTMLVWVGAIAMIYSLPETSSPQTAGQPSGSVPALRPTAPELRVSDPETAVGRWVADTPLNGGRVWHATASKGPNIYVMGGFNRPSGAGSDIRYRTTEWTAVDSDGTLAIWKPGPPMTRIRIGGSAVVIGKYLYVLGGETGELGQACSGPETCFTASVERAEIRSDGSLGAWELVGAMLAERWGFAAVVAGTNLYVIGGNDGKQATTSVERATISPAGDVGPWQRATSLKVRRWASAAVHHGGYLYALGGQDGENTIRTVERTRIQADGSLAEWALVGSMLDRRQGGRAFADERRLYVVGGYSGVGPGSTSNNEYLSAGETAAFAEDGTLAAWGTLPPMKSRRGYHGLAMVGGTLYALGGGNGDVFVPTVERLQPGKAER